MTATSTRRVTAPGANGSHTSGRPASVTSGSRSAPMALVGLACVVIGAVVFLAAHVGLDRREPVLVVARPVASGQVVVADDLAVAEVSLSSGARSVPASRRAQVVGKTATVGLVPGAVLAPAQLGASSALEPGQAVVGVALKAGQAPRGLRAGTRVQVVDTGGSGVTAAPAVVSTLAVVVDAGLAQPGSGVAVVSLRLPADDAVGVAAAGAAGRASLVVLPAP